MSLLLNGESSRKLHSCNANNASLLSKTTMTTSSPPTLIFNHKTCPASLRQLIEVTTFRLTLRWVGTTLTMKNHQNWQRLTIWLNKRRWKQKRKNSVSLLFTVIEEDSLQPMFVTSTSDQRLELADLRLLWPHP